MGLRDLCCIPSSLVLWSVHASPVLLVLSLQNMKVLLFPFCKWGNEIENLSMCFYCRWKDTWAVCVITDLEQYTQRSEPGNWFRTTSMQWYLNVPALTLVHTSTAVLCHMWFLAWEPTAQRALHHPLLWGVNLSWMTCPRSHRKTLAEQGLNVTFLLNSKSTFFNFVSRLRKL